MQRRVIDKNGLHHVYTNQYKITNPKEKIIYHIKSKLTQTDEVCVTFSADMPKLAYFEINTFLYKKVDESEEACLKFKEESLVFIHKNSLPVSSLHHDFPPKIYYLNKPDFIYTITHIEIAYDKKLEEYYLQNIKIIPCKELQIASKDLQKLTQNKVEFMHVVAGQYPLLNEPNRPSYPFLYQLYKKYIQYNDDKKITEQRHQSNGWCSARAHFVTTLLNKYGISSYKIFKSWNLLDWYTDTYNNRWKYHGATLIIDDNHKQWVWDPWEGLNHTLIPAKKWILNQSCPTPIRVLIANPCILTDHRTGISTQDRIFSKIPSTDFLRSFQAIYASSIPNPPEYPLIDKSTYGLFSVKQKKIGERHCQSDHAKSLQCQHLIT